jgi:hypothetical protein
MADDARLRIFDPQVPAQQILRRARSALLSPPFHQQILRRAHRPLLGSNSLPITAASLQPGAM